jgi:hypothetical protein
MFSPRTFPKLKGKVNFHMLVEASGLEGRKYAVRPRKSYSIE